MTYTAAELREFRKLVDRAGARGFDNADRVLARIEMKTFVAKHGKAKCDAMWAEIK